jgi:hypothetical protein
VTGPQGPNEEKLYETSNPADIKAFDDALHPKVPTSVYACLCGYTVTVHLYKGAKELEKIEYIAPDEVVADSWNSYTHISKARDLVDWFEARGINYPEVHYQAYYSIGGHGGDGEDIALPELEKRFPNFKWDYMTAVQADLDGDGEFDFAMLGYTKDKAALGVIMGKKIDGKLIVKIIEFGTDTQSERSIGGRIGKLSVYPDDMSPTDATGQQPQGYKICDDCFQIKVQGDGDMDPLWIYWNHVTNDLDWWRA